MITSDAWGQLPSIVKQAMVGATLEQIGEGVAAAAHAGGFDRSEAHLTRSPLVLDERAWREIAVKLDQLLAALERIGRAAEKRLANRNHEGEMRATAFEAAVGKIARSEQASERLQTHPPRVTRVAAWQLGRISPSPTEKPE